MKSRIDRDEPALRVVRKKGQQGSQHRDKQRALHVPGVLQDVQHAFEGLCVQAGLQALQELMEADRVALCGRKGVPDEARTAVRGGHTPASVVLGGQRLPVQRPRVRGRDNSELALPSYEWASACDPLNAATMAAVAAGVSTRRYAGVNRTVPNPFRARQDATSKSAVSRRFVDKSAQQLKQALGAPLGKLDLPVVMIDGIYLAGSVILVALGIDARGHKHVLGLHEGSTENTRVVKALLAELIERGLQADRARLWVIDGGKALRRAITECFGTLALVQRCQEHKRRNVLEHLPEAKQAGVGKALRDAWDSGNAQLAHKRLARLANALEAQHPGAARSLREGLAESLTVQALGIPGALYRTLRTTNPIENLNGSIARYVRNVKRWKNGQMIERWVASALQDAQDRFRRLLGFRDMPKLLAALDAHACNLKHSEAPHPTKKAA
jgi:putative transposase